MWSWQATLLVLSDVVEFFWLTNVHGKVIDRVHDDSPQIRSDGPWMPEV